MNESVYKYPRQFIVGIWLIMIGISMFTLLIKVPDGSPNPILFGIIYSVGMFWQLNKRTRAKYSVGPGTKKQKMWSNLSIIILMILILVSLLLVRSLHVNSNQTIYYIWVLILISVGLHFFSFIPVHGKIIGILGFILALLETVFVILKVPLDLIFVSDGIIKIVFGIIYLRLSPINF